MSTRRRSRGALHLNAADGGRLELRHQVVADLPVLDHELAVVALLEPTGLPVRRDPEPEAVGVYLLAHLLVLALLVRVGSGRLSVAVESSTTSSSSVPPSTVSASVTSASASLRRSSATRLVGDVLVGLCGLGCRRGRARPRPWPAAARRRDRRPDRSARRREASTRRDRLALTASMRGGAARACRREPAHDDGDVAGPLADPRGPATCPGAPALHGGALVGVAGRDVELLGVLLVVVRPRWPRPRPAPCR